MPRWFNVDMVNDRHIIIAWVPKIAPVFLRAARVLFFNTALIRTSFFTLICNESLEGQLTALGERGIQAIYDFELRSKYACIKGGTTGVSISIGTVLVIVFVSLVFLYIVGGILFQTFVRKATGKERFPNYDMWRQFPVYVKVCSKALLCNLYIIRKMRPEYSFELARTTLV
ncbi:hypothetical protein CHS0354_007992 [Potamilus streckersoni]|uniref:Uncharacterized protein n=1 Tax=Potamilus streckersoni TaxID=2493646 RepID=A0AAE0SCL3_9BIVA|nr:hypothetical protein CHS0354_007992 [Potamilus streckersoni]